MLVNIHFQKWPLEFINNNILIYDSDKGSGTEIKKKTADVLSILARALKCSVFLSWRTRFVLPNTSAVADHVKTTGHKLAVSGIISRF